MECLSLNNKICAIQFTINSARNDVQNLEMFSAIDIIANNGISKMLQV